MSQVIPLVYYTRNVPPGTAAVATTVRSVSSQTYGNYDAFHRDVVSQMYNHYQQKRPTDRQKHSWLHFLNPFECDNDEYSDRDAPDAEDAEDVDYDDYDNDSGELFKRRKFLTLFKLKKLKKLKKLMKLKELKEKLKKKKKKKIVLLKILLGILVFFAVKALLEKLYYYYPTLVAYAGGRDELYHDGEHELDRNVDFKDVGENDGVEHRSLLLQKSYRRSVN